MTDHEALEALSKKATQTEDDIRYYSGGSKYNEPLEQLKDRLVNLYRTDQLIPAPSVDDAMVERVAISLAEFDRANWDAQSFSETPAGETPEEMRQGYRAKATAAISAMQVKP